MTENSFSVASAAWDVENESLEHINQRIHDGKPLDQLHQRGDWYVSTAFNQFNYVELQGAEVLDIGSGVGFIMEALDRHLRPRFPTRSITGLDISQSMIEKAKLRLTDSPSFTDGTLKFAHYDGLTVPFEDNKFDLIFSVAALQHVPKPYVYNLFFEMKRILKDDGYAIIHLLPFRNLELDRSWRQETAQQVAGAAGHWHHFYTAEELYYVLFHGTGFAHVDTAAHGQWTCIRKTPKL